MTCPNCGSESPEKGRSCALCNYVFKHAPPAGVEPCEPLEDLAGAPPTPEKGKPEGRKKTPAPETPTPSSIYKRWKDLPPQQRIPLGRFPQRIPLAEGQQPPPKKAVRLKCPSCGTVNKLGAKFCEMCRINFKPLHKNPATDEAPAAPPPASPPGSPSSKKFILIVEDDPHLASMLGDFLETLGVEWRTESADAMDAVVQAEALNIGLVLMDIMLSGAMTGIDAYRMLRASPHVSESLPVIFITALTPEKARSMVPQDDPMVKLLHKPFNFELIKKTIRGLTGAMFLK